MSNESDSVRKLRHKERKVYTDEVSDDEIEGKRTFNLDSKLASHNYNAQFVKEMKAEDFTMKYVQENGLCVPIIFYDKTGLGMRIPSENFKVSDVKQCVGSRRMLDVMDVNTQKGLNMSMKEWCSYYEEKERDRLLNVISLEFSHTRLDTYVECPKLVRDLDWVDCVWPKHLKECQTEGTNLIEKMKYPKVQKYCLMSVAGCYTDFHMDFGGTSVWYHVLHGSKIFWMIPPTEDNIHLYEQWILSGKQGDIFFGDQVRECQRIKLKAGDTFIIPTGWIHGVFTPDDSLVFGGNFIHSFNMVKQLQIVEVEDRTHVPQKFRYPFFGEMLWYVLERYVRCMMGKNHLSKYEGDDASSAPETDYEKSPSPPSDIANEGDKSKSASNQSNSVDLQDNSEPPELSPPHSPIYEEHSYISSPHSPRSPHSPPDKIPQLAEAYVKLQPLNDNDKHLPRISNGDSGDGPSKAVEQSQPQRLTKWEREGLQAILDRLTDLPVNKKCIPNDITDPDALLNDVMLLLHEHALDNQNEAVSGKLIIGIPEEEKKIKLKSIYPTTKKPRQPKGAPKKQASGVRHRRVRCKACEACTRSDCGECNFCKDMKKYGGPGRMKQSCISRQCMRPSLASASICMICGQNSSVTDDDGDSIDNMLMECGICWEITHPACLREKNPSLTSDGTVNEDLPNSWECCKCCEEGFQGQIKPRLPKGGLKRTESRQASVDSETSTTSHQSQGDIKVEPTDSGNQGASGDGVPSMSNNPAEDVEMPMLAKKKVSTDQQTTPKKSEETKSPKTDSIKKNDRVPKEETSPKSSQENMEPPSLPREKPDGERPKKPKKKINIKSGSPKASRKSAGIDSPKKSRKSVGLESPKASAKSAGRKRKENGVEHMTTPKKKVKEETATKEKESPHKSLGSSPEGTSLAATRPKRETGSSVKTHQSTNGSEDSANDAKQHLYPGKKLKKRGRKPKRKTKLKLKLAVSEELAHTSSTIERDNDPIPPTTSARFMKSGNLKHCPKIAQISEDIACLPERPLMPFKHVVRPLPRPPPPSEVLTEGGANHALGRDMWLEVFSYLDHPSLARCMCVCKTWYYWCLEKRFWYKLSFSHRKITQQKLIAIVRRQPSILDLSWTNISFKQLTWLKDRLPQLKYLNMSGCSWASLSCLCSVYCPLLQSLDVSWVENVDSIAIKELLSPPSDHRPGVIESISRLHCLTEFNLSGTDVSDTCFCAITRHLTRLEKLHISHCPKLTNNTIELISAHGSKSRSSLRRIDASFCGSLTNDCVEYFKRIPNIEYIDLRGCEKVSVAILKRFVNTCRNKSLILHDGKLIQTVQESKICSV